MKTEVKRNIVEVLDNVAMHLGNTRAVCKKYYVHPIILDLYENSRLNPYLARISKPASSISHEDLSHEEQLLITILEEEGLVCV